MQAHVLSINGQPVNSGLANMQKRKRQLPAMQRALATAHIPQVYVFNVGRRSWPNRVGGQRSFNIPACLKGKEHSEPLVIDGIFLSEFDLADGAMNIGVATDPGLTSVVDGQKVFGVANDIVGTSSGSAALGENTTNLEWFGVFATANNPPTDEEVLEAHAKLRQMMELIYSKGKQIVEQNMPEHKDLSIRMTERKNYNEAAEYLGHPALFGSGDSSALTQCPECLEPIKAGAKFCKHCSQAIDPASVAARAAKREKANKEIAI